LSYCLVHAYHLKRIQAVLNPAPGNEFDRSLTTHARNDRGVHSLTNARFTAGYEVSAFVIAQGAVRSRA